MHSLRSSARLFAVLTAGWSLGGCLFPVIDFDEHSASRELSELSWRTPKSPGALPEDGVGTATRLRLATPERQHLPVSEHEADHEAAPLPVRRDAPSTQLRPSVVAPSVPAPEPVPPGEARACHEALRRAGIAFSVVATRDAPGVLWPVRLAGPVRGVSFEPEDHSAAHAILDCRLALALRAWAHELRRAGIRRVEYFSMYRPFARIAGSGGVSGHAHGLAIDAARFALQSGAVVDVLEDWEGRERGQAPCPERPAEAKRARLLRSITCSAAEQKLFQIVLTPHYNKAHDNHLHLEIKPEVSWTYVR